MNGYSYLTLEERRVMERMYAEGERVVDIATRLKRSVAAIYEEWKRQLYGRIRRIRPPEVQRGDCTSDGARKPPTQRKPTRRELLKTRGAIQYERYDSKVGDWRL